MPKCLTIVDDATTGVVAVVPARALGGLAVTRILDRFGVPHNFINDMPSVRTGIADVSGMCGSSWEMPW